MRPPPAPPTSRPRNRSPSTLPSRTGRPGSGGAGRRSRRSSGSRPSRPGCAMPATMAVPVRSSSGTTVTCSTGSSHGTGRGSTGSCHPAGRATPRSLVVTWPGGAVTTGSLTDLPTTLPLTSAATLTTSGSTATTSRTRSLRLDVWLTLLLGRRARGQPDWSNCDPTYAGWVGFGAGAAGAGAGATGAGAATGGALTGAGAGVVTGAGAAVAAGAGTLV